MCGQLIARPGSDYPALLRDRILKPLGMTETAVSDHARTASAGRSRLGLRRRVWITDGHAPVAGRGRSMFWVIDTPAGTAQPVIWHNGATGGYSAFLSLAPESGRGVVVLSSVSGPSRTARVATALSDCSPISPD